MFFCLANLLTVILAEPPKGTTEPDKKKKGFIYYLTFITA
jgi:hypothetical protein